MPDLVIIGTVAFDDVETPFGKVTKALGGSGSYASLAASFFTKPAVLSIVGDDFPKNYLELLQKHGVNTEAIAHSGKTFHWAGSYEYDMNEAKTLKTDLNALADFHPVLSPEHQKAKYLFLANIDPVLQLDVLNQMQHKAFVMVDTMNYWISSNRDDLIKVLKRVDAVLLNDAEARQLFDTSNLVVAAQKVLELGPTYVIIKKGEHGALLFSKNSHFSAPSYPLEVVKDPTGAGDSFAGGLIGYLASQGGPDHINEKTVRQGMIYGSAVASMCAEDFSVNYISQVNRQKIEERYAIFQNISQF